MSLELEEKTANACKGEKVCTEGNLILKLEQNAKTAYRILYRLEGGRFYHHLLLA